MKVDRNSLTAGALAYTLQAAPIGVLVKGVTGIDPIQVAQAAAVQLDRDLNVAIVGYGLAAASSHGRNTVSYDIESAVGWRSIPELARHVVAFVKIDVPKLHSLGDLDLVTTRHISQFLVKAAATELVANQPQERFWNILADEAGTFPLDLLEDFVSAIQTDRENVYAIPTNLWRLGLLRDDQILQSNRDPAERLHRNRELLLEVAELSEESRRRLRSVLVKATGDEKQRLISAFGHLKDFYSRGDRAALALLDLSTVETLIKAGRPIPSATPTPAPTALPQPPAPEGEEDSESGVGDRGNLPPGKPLSGKALEKELSKCFASRDPLAQKALREIGEAIVDRINNPNSDKKTINVTHLFDEKPIQPELLSPELLRFIGSVCAEDKWGAVVRTTQKTLKEAIARFSPEEITPYNPASTQDGMGQQSLLTLLSEFDQQIAEGERFGPFIEALMTTRRQLLTHIELLLGYPMILFGGYPEARQALDDYLNAYAGICRVFKKNEITFHRSDSMITKYVASQLLRLDAIYFRCPGEHAQSVEWKGMVTPLHPLHLWRFREILRAVHAGARPLTQEETNLLAKALPDMPHVLQFLAMTPQDTESEYPLPLAGSVGLLPTFENHTNRYLGADGVEFLEDLLVHWVAQVPYSHPEIRVALIDVPDIRAAMRQVAGFLQRKPHTRVVLGFHFTRSQNASGELARLDYDDYDHDITEQMRNDHLRVQVYSYEANEKGSALARVAEALRIRPVHIAYVFDQSHYSVDSSGIRTPGLVVSPLVVTHDYKYSPTIRRGTISPSAETEDGLFADYYFLIKEASNIPASRALRWQADPGADLGSVNALLEEQAVRWLAIADRLLTGYAPTSAVPMGEQQIGQREVAVWAGDDSRVVIQLVDLLRRYNFKPDTSTVAHLLRQYGHNAIGGLFSLPATATGGNATARERKEKGLLGTILATAWYQRHYPGSLVASLDSTRARTWLKGGPNGNERADLIGLRVEEDRSLVVEVIEVKTHEDNPGIRFERDPETNLRRLVGEPIDQLTATLATLDPVFGGDDPQPLFTPARREVIKYQLHRECFREIHGLEGDGQWQKQWYDRLSDAFARPSRIAVKCRGLVIHVKLEEPTGVVRVDDETQALSMITLGAGAVQDLVVSASVEEGNHQDQQQTPSIPSSNTEFSSAPNSSEPGESMETRGQAVTQTSRAIASIETTEGPQDGIRVQFVDAFDRPDPSEARELVRLFKRACDAYRVQLAECDPDRIIAGPTVLRMYIRLGRGQQLRTLKNALEDIGREMRRSDLLVSPIPNSDEIALDIPRTQRAIIPLERGLSALPQVMIGSQMPIAIGVTPEGNDLVRDLREMPHMLVGGTTGAGKTMFLYGVLLSLLSTHPDPNTLQLLLTTSKSEDFVFFEGVPHLRTGHIVDDAEEAVRLFETHIAEALDERGRILNDARSRSIEDYNARHESSPIPPLVVVVDEFADLADQFGSDRPAKEEFYSYLRRAAQLGRNRGIHLVLCTQRPSHDLVPTNIRNLMNVRVGLRVNDSAASKMILDEPGAEQLQLHGDLLFKEGGGLLVRAQSYLINEDELDMRLAPLK